MGIFNRIKNSVGKQEVFQMISTTSEGFYSFDGKLYKSDIIRACIRPKTSALGKMVAKHIRETVIEEGRKIEINPEPYMKFLLKEPNPIMTMQDLQEKMSNQLALNNNAFALIVRDENGLPYQIWPIPATTAVAKVENGEIKIKFSVFGRYYTFLYSDIIHLRGDYCENYFFGTSPVGALTELMEAVTIIDQGIVKAIKNSSIIRWLLKFTVNLKPEDIKKNVKQFVDNYLSTETETFGAAGVDSKTEATRIEPKDFVPNAATINSITKRIYSFFNTNEKIVMSLATEEEWNAYYEQEIEPVAIKFQNEFTRKLFTRKQQGFGNSIYFESSSLDHASLQTKISLVAMVDRQALTPNEWRDAFRWAPLPGGDKPLRRLDTKQVGKEGDGE